MAMSEQQLGLWLALHKTPGIGPRKFAAILKNFPDLGKFFALSKNELQELRLEDQTISAIVAPCWKIIEKEIAWSNQNQNHIITLQHQDYPALLKEISDPPPILYAKGDIKLLHRAQIAIVGARKATQHGSQTAYQFAEALGKNGFIITSGLALGIDSASHRGALDNNQLTIAVLGTGLGHIYPRQNRSIFDKIATNGLIISEFPISQGPRPQNFPRRNRVISGLSQGILVVEAALKSGSLITARLALEQGRDVFAVPGSIHNPLAKGCHKLIKEGAKLVETLADILPELPPIKTTQEPALPPLKQHEQMLLEHVDFHPTTTDLIIHRCDDDTKIVTGNLIRLELKGYIMAMPGGYQRLH